MAPMSRGTFEAEGAAETTDVDPNLWAALGTPAAASARHAIFERHVVWAKGVARRHFLDRSRGDIEFADLCQLAYAGLLEAIDQFDHRRGVPFKGFASRRITGSILDGIAKTSEIRQQISARNRMRQERARSLAAEDGGGASAAQALAALSELASGLALGFMLEDANLLTLAEQSDPSITAYESLAWKDVLGRLSFEVSQLTARDQSIIAYHYRDGLTFDQIAAILGISKGRVSQVHKSTINLLKKRLINKGVSSIIP